MAGKAEEKNKKTKNPSIKSGKKSSAKKAPAKKVVPKDVVKKVGGGRCKVCKSGYAFLVDYMIISKKKSYSEIADIINQQQNKVVLTKQNIYDHNHNGHMAPLMDVFVKVFHKDIQSLDEIPEEELQIDVMEIIDQRIFLAFLNELVEASNNGFISLSKKELTDLLKIRAQFSEEKEEAEILNRRIQQYEYILRIAVEVMTIPQREEVKSRIDALDFLKDSAIGRRIIPALPEVKEEV